MADLQQILSAIIRDISKARFSSDLYSRSIARYYENDYLLRRFPIPRTEIDEVELDLKFAIEKIAENTVNGEGKEANLAFVLERTTEELVATFLDLAVSFTQDKKNADWLQQMHQVIQKGFKSTVLRIEMRQYLLRYFIESYTHLIDHDGNFDQQLAEDSIGRPLMLAMYQFRQPEKDISVAEFIRFMEPMVTHILSSKSFDATLSSLKKPIEIIWQRSNDVRLEVQINDDNLRELPESVISSIKVRASVRNHMWSEVKVGERQTKRMLTSE